MRASILSVKDLSKVYIQGRQTTPVLSAVNFSLTQGEFVSLIGPNGCGKSTFLKIISGIIPQTTGQITGSTDVSYMPQHHALFPWRTVEENLFLPGDVVGVSRNLVRANVRSLLKQFNLLSFADYYPVNLSGGTAQKVALLRTVLCNGSILALDEPFAPLDALTRLSCQQWLLKLCQSISASVIFVTHDIREAILLSDRIVVMSKLPGTVKKTFSVSLGRPRDYTIFSKHTVSQLEKELMTLLVD